MKKERRAITNQYQTNFLWLANWIKLIKKNISLSIFFEENEIKKIAVYGMGMIGELLVDELENTSVEVVYAIDKKKGNSKSNGINILGIDEPWYEGVDAIVVTPVHDYILIYELLSKKTEASIISMEDIILYYE